MVNHTKSIISPTVPERHETSVSSFSGQAIETNRLVTVLLEANSVQGNEYFVAMNRPVLIKAQTWNLPDFPGYTFLNGEKGLTKKLCFDEIASENLAEEIKSWLLDGVANGAGYGLILLIVAFFRELLGSGTLFGIDILNRFGYVPNNLVILPPFALILLGCIVWVQRSIQKDLQEK